MGNTKDAEVVIREQFKRDVGKFVDRLVPDINQFFPQIEGFRKSLYTPIKWGEEYYAFICSLLDTNVHLWIGPRVNFTGRGGFKYTIFVTVEFPHYSGQRRRFDEDFDVSNKEMYTKEEMEKAEKAIRAFLIEKINEYWDTEGYRYTR